MNVNTARPEESSVANPSVLLPSRRMTVPVGTPAPVKAGVTVTVSTSGLPTGAGLADAVKVVVVAAWLTVTLSVAGPLGAKVDVPLKTAVRVWLPDGENAVASTARPRASRLAVPRAPEWASKKVTVPDGVPTGLVTVAVKWTIWPTVGALTSTARVVVVAAAAGGGVPTR